MIRISKLTDYGVLIMSHMTQTPAAVMSASDLAASLHLPLPTVSKVLKSLSQAGLLSSRRGIAGGYLLNKAPEQISLMEIITALDGPISLTECSGSMSDCAIEAECGLRNHWIGINRLVYDLFAQIDLAKFNQDHLMKSSEVFKGVKQ